MSGLRMKKLLLAGMCLALLLAPGCAGRNARTDGNPPVSSLPTGERLGIPFPDSFALDRDASAVELLARSGDDIAASLGSRNLTTDAGQGTASFTPLDASTPAAERCSWAIYSLSPGQSALPQLSLDWQAAPADGSLYIGFANWSAGRWYWQRPENGGMASVPGLIDCTESISGQLLVAIVVQDQPSAVLREVRLQSIGSDYLPDGPHPRLWLTPERLSGLTDAMNSNTPEWQLFNIRAQQYQTELYWAGLNHTIPYPLLMYKLTGDEQYAQRAFQLLDDAPLEWEISCCPYHCQIHHIALGYDWLYDHPNMTPARKAAYIAKLETFSDMLWEDALFSDGVGNSQDTDRVCMAGATLATIGCALWGDSERAPEIFERGWRMFTKGAGDPPDSGVWREYTDAASVRHWVQGWGQGPWPSGWFYCTGTDFYGLKDWAETLRTACGYDVNELEPGFDTLWDSQIRAFIYSMSPDGDHAYSGSDWQDGDLLSGQAYIHTALASWADEAEQNGDGESAAWARHLQRNLPGYHTDPFREFFFSASGNLAEADPFDANLPLVAKYGPVDMLSFRTGWGSTDSWGVFSGQGSVPCDHMQPDSGHFSLQRNGQFLTREAPGYKSFECGAQTYNTLSIENDTEQGHMKTTGMDAPASLLRWRCSDSPLLAYAMLQADDNYDDNPDSWDPTLRVNSYRRHFVWVGDYLVVLDRLRTADSGWCLYRLRSETEPQLIGDTINQTSADGSQRLLHRTLEPAGCQISVVDEKQLLAEYYQYEVPDYQRLWQTQVSPPESDSVDILSVIRMGDSSLTDFDANLQHISDAANAGVVQGPLCAVFAREEMLRSGCSYTVDAPQAGMLHLVGDLEPGSYSVTVNGQPAGVYACNSSDNTILFSTDDESAVSVVITKQ
ncbi:MAG: hypothetical protein H7A35_14345 [Planctomycetales bacterium]|nr:hypothetical protein [bacterium]UNM08016.1 MAG: hypothetical protein H7A35_14345 [Planctomycetales bacterium]